MVRPGRLRPAHRMSAPLRRNRDPDPLARGWEVAFVVATVALSAVTCAALAGVGIAAAWWGSGWVWPASARDIGPVVMGLLQGRPGDGYSAPSAEQLASPGPTYVLVASVEALLLVGAGLVGAGLRRHLGLGQRRGMATRAQAEEALGVSRLRAARSVIRPDLAAN